MPRARKIGLTEEQKDKVLHYDRLSPEERKVVAYGVREVLEKELDDIEWLMGQAPEAFKRQRYKEYQFPIEVVMPKKANLTIGRLDGWIKVLEEIKVLVQTFEFRTYRKG